MDLSSQGDKMSERSSQLDPSPSPGSMLPPIALAAADLSRLRGGRRSAPAVGEPIAPSRNQQPSRAFE